MASPHHPAFSAYEKFKKDVLKEAKQDEYKKIFQIAKIKNNLSSFLSYLNYKDEKEAKTNLFKDASDSQLPPNFSPAAASVAATALSYLGFKTNQENAEKSLKILFNAIDSMEKKEEPEPIIVIFALKELSLIYKELPKRSGYSVANLLWEPPKLATAIENLFKEFNMKPDDELIGEKAFTIHKEYYA